MSKRILFVVNHAGFFLSHRLPIASAASRAGYEIHVATPRSKHVPRIVEAGLYWHEIQLSRSGTNPFVEFATLRSLYSLYRSVLPDLVHHVTSKPVLYGTLMARIARVPAVVNAISGLGHIFASEGGIGHRAVRALVNLAYRSAIRHPRMRVIFQNADHRDTFIAKRWAREADCVLIPGSGVDPNEFAPGHRQLSGDPPVVVFASRMLHTKGIVEFVEAARSLKRRGVRARFLLVGEPDPDNRASVSRETIEAWVDEGIVEYTGRRNDMAEVFRDADIACLPSYSEGMPKVLLEAASAGLAIVTTDIPGCREVVHDGENGFLVPVRDREKLADALERLIADRDLRSRFGLRGRERILEEFALSIIVTRTLDVYSELTS